MAKNRFDFYREYQWKATFFVSKFQKLSRQARNGLLTLQAHGHEIGFHGDNHLSAVPLIDSIGFERYFATEHSQLQLLKDFGLHIFSFAYPNGSRNNYSDSSLLRYYTGLRGVTNKERSAKDGSCFYTAFPVVDGIGIEKKYKYFSEEYLFQLLEFARINNRVLVIYGHKTVPAASKEKHEVDYRTIRFICDYIKKYEMRFYTMSDLSHFINP